MYVPDNWNVFIILVIDVFKFLYGLIALVPLSWRVLIASNILGYLTGVFIIDTSIYECEEIWTDSTTLKTA